MLSISTALVGTTSTVIALIAFRLAFGAAFSMIRLSRQTFVTRRVATHLRGRAMSMIGGSFRLSFLIGPLLGGLLVDAVGYATTLVIAGALAATGLGTTLRPSQLPLLDTA